MSSLEVILLAVYFVVLVTLSLYGTHRYWITFLYYRHQQQKALRRFIADSDLPHVTVQLPVFNERYVVNRLIDAVCRLDYPRERLSIQVLDDSTDDTTQLARSAVEHYASQGFDIALLHRTDRTGYKAGALAAGIAVMRSELVAVFDADFIPSPEFLRDTVGHFADPDVGMVQVRWGHMNRDFSLLTRAQSILLDGHFVLEHSARNRSGLFFNFNGTAGVWRKQAIIDGGGWQHDTLTEDLDLSYRAQLAGWRFVFLQDVVANGEVPVDINAFKSQQHRWAKGSAQTALKLLPRLWRADVPWRIKSEAFFHLTANFAYPLLVVLSLLMPLAITVRHHHSLVEVLLLDLPCFFAATFSVCTFYAISQKELRQATWDRLRCLPFVMALGIGISLSNAKAVLEAFAGHDTPFNRTPKHGVISDDKASWFKQTASLAWSYRGDRSLLPWLELLLGAYYSLTIYAAISARHFAVLPFLFMFQIGFLYVGFVSLVHASWLTRVRAWFSAENGDVKTAADRF